MRGMLTRRRFLGGSAAALGMGGATGSLHAQSQRLVVCTWGGALRAAQRTHYFEPFERESGVRITVADQPSIARIRAMVEAGSTEWDLAQVSLSEMIAAQQANLLEPIDYSGFPRSLIDAMHPTIVRSHGIGAQMVTSCICYSTRAFSAANHPASWADVWDVARFPGPRSLQSMDTGSRPLEAALLADGVEVANLYPLDIDRGFRSLDRLRPHVPKWGGRGTNIHDLIVTGEAVIGNASSARVITMKEEGAPIDFEFNQALQFADLWVIPKGARNYANAVRFLQFASGARQQAAFSAAYPLDPVNREAFAHLTPQQAARLATAPGTVGSTVVVNADWWAAAGTAGRSNIDVVSDRWRRWVR